jgi:hypothetical protein
VSDQANLERAYALQPKYSELFMVGEAEDKVLTIRAVRQAQLILSDCIEPGPSAERTIERLLDVLDRDDVVEAVVRLEEATGLREDER